jgi:hypothetical protein
MNPYPPPSRNLSPPTSNSPRPSQATARRRARGSPSRPPPHRGPGRGGDPTSADSDFAETSGPARPDRPARTARNSRFHLKRRFAVSKPPSESFHVAREPDSRQPGADAGPEPLQPMGGGGRRSGRTRRGWAVSRLACVGAGPARLETRNRSGGAACARWDGAEWRRGMEARARGGPGRRAPRCRGGVPRGRIAAARAMRDGRSGNR